MGLVVTEVKLLGRNWLYWVMALLAFIFGVFLIHNQTPDTDIDLGGGYFLIKTFMVQLLALPAVVAILAARAFTRDFESNMAPLVYSASFDLRTLLLGRFLALVLVCGGVYLVFSAGMLTGLLMTGQWVSFIALSSLAWALGVLLIPNLLLMSVCMLAIGIYFRRSIYLFIFAGILFFGYQFFLMYSGSPLMATKSQPDPSLVIWFARLDPFAFASYFELIKEWGTEQKNQQFPGVNQTLLTNRVLVMTTTFILLSVVLQRFMAHFQLFGGTESAAAKNNPMLTVIGAVIRQVNSLLPSMPSQFASQALVLIVAQFECQRTIQTKVFGAMTVLLALAIGSEIYFGYNHLENLGVSAVASTMITVNRYMVDVLPRIGGLFILILAAELFWRDNQTKIKPLIDCSPVSNTALFGGRVMALCIVPLLFVTLGNLLSVCLQWYFNGEIEANVYLALYYYAGAPMVWLAICCAVVHGLVSNKYLGLAITFFVYLWANINIAPSLGLVHPLWRIGYFPLPSYSEIYGFGPHVDGFFGFALLWFSLLLTALTVVIRHLPRGTELSVFSRTVLQHHIKQTWRYPEKVTFSLMACLTVFALGNVLYKSLYEGDYLTRAPDDDWKFRYEMKYSDFKEQPSLTANVVDTQIDLYPSERRLSISTKYELINRTAYPISQLLVTIPKVLTLSEVKLANAKLESFDEALNTYRYSFDSAILPGKTATFDFSGTYKQNGYVQASSDNVLTDDFAYFRFLRYLPWFGYLKHYQLNSDNTRREYGLDPLQNNTLEQDMEKYAGDMSRFYDWANLRTQVSTEEDHIAIAPGELTREWEQQGRRYFAYQTNQTIRNFGHVVSSNLPRMQAVQDGVNIDVFYPPGRVEYASRHMEAIKDTLAYGNQHFGRINANDVRLVAMPNVMSATGYAMPQTVFIEESIGFHVDLNDTHAFDHLYRRTAHEIAHQWWGHGLNPAATEGEGVLMETLAKYTEMILLEKKYGVEYVKRLIRYEQQRYLSGRSRAIVKELPLYRADDAYLIYSKGAVAMYALRHELGESKMNQALAMLNNLHAFPDKPATTLDLIEYLSMNSTPAEHELINEWFMEMTIYDVKVAQFNLVTTPDGQQQLTFCVDPGKAEPVRVYASILDSADVEIKTRVLNRDNDFCASTYFLEEPASIHVDPDLLLLDSNRDNNRLQLAR